MKWKQLFSPVKSLSAEAARAYIDDRSEGDYTLLDVRQPKEYADSRIPGAKLVPLPELTGRLDELDPEKPVVTY